MKKKIVIVLLIVTLVVLLFPNRNQLKDGGTVEYQSLVYKISKVKSTNTTIINVSNRELHIDYVSSHLEFGFWKSKFPRRRHAGAWCLDSTSCR